jgi:hypothetical protein
MKENLLDPGRLIVTGLYEQKQRASTTLSRHGRLTFEGTARTQAASTVSQHSVFNHHSVYLSTLARAHDCKPDSS